MMPYSRESLPGAGRMTWTPVCPGSVSERCTKSCNACSNAASQPVFTVRVIAIWIGSFIFSLISCNFRNDLIFLETHFGKAGGLVVGSAKTRSTEHHRRITQLFQAKNVVIFGRLKTFHRTGVNAEQCRRRHKIAEGDISLTRGPAVDVKTVFGLRYETHHHATKVV